MRERHRGRERERQSERARECERDKVTQRQREFSQNVRESEWRSVRVGRPRERVRTRRQSRTEERDDHGWRTLCKMEERDDHRWQKVSNRRINWNDINGRSAVCWNARMEEPPKDNSDHEDWVIVSRNRKNKTEASRRRMERNNYQRKEKQMT